MIGRIIELAIVAHVAGLFLGGALVYLILIRAKHYFLEVPRPLASPEVFQRYLERNAQLKELNSATRQSLDKLAHNGN